MDTVNQQIDQNSITARVMEDLKSRYWVGLEEYGKPLKAWGGNIALQDAYEEALDLALYLKQELEEQEATQGFESLAAKVIKWADERKFFDAHSGVTPITQLAKTLEEVGEALAAIESGDDMAVLDAFGDILVTLIIAFEDHFQGRFDLVDALEHAYEEIKDRQGYMKHGQFVKTP